MMEATGLKRSMDRRGAIKLFGLYAGAVASTFALKSDAFASSGPTYFRTTTSVNFRKSASSNAQILSVLPAGTQLQNLGASSNGYQKVKYNGKTGWVYGTYLESDLGEGGGPDGDFEFIGHAITSTSVNFRTGPSTGDVVIQVLPKGTLLEITDWTQAGFRYAKYGSSSGWVYDQYLDPAQAENGLVFETATSVNFRKSPNTSAQVLQVIPKGKLVYDYDDILQNGFRGVTYGNQNGWIHNDYLTKKQ